MRLKENLATGIILFVFSLFSIPANSQIFDPVKWTTSVEKVDNDQYNLVVTAEIENGWHLYSQNVPQGGPIPTTFRLKPSESYMRIGSVIEEEGKEVDDAVFEMRIKYFEGKTVFKQPIKRKDNKSFVLTGEVEFMVCDDQRCLPPEEVKLSFTLPNTGK